MNEDFVSYDLAVKLKEKGFDWKVCGMYTQCVKLIQFDLLFKPKNWNELTGHYAAPTISQVLKWLREEKNTYVLVDFVDKSWLFDLRCLRTGFIAENDVCRYETYEQAAIAGIEYVLDNLL